MNDLKLFVEGSRTYCCGEPMEPVGLQDYNGWRCKICGRTVADLVSCDKDIIINNHEDVSFVSMLSDTIPAFCRIEHKVTETTATSDNGESSIPIYLIISRAVWRSGKDNKEKELRIERRVRRFSRRIKDRDLIRLEKAQNAADLTAIALTMESV